MVWAWRSAARKVLETGYTDTPSGPRGYDPRRDLDGGPESAPGPGRIGGQTWRPARLAGAAPLAGVAGEHVRPLVVHADQVRPVGGLGEHVGPGAVPGVGVGRPVHDD